MAGNDQAEKAAAFLSRLIDGDVSPDTPVRLRSVQRAAFLSWARKEGLPVNEQLMTGPGSVSVLELLGGQTQDTPPPIAARSVHAPVGIGIDIEDVAALPHADDYRDHAFFQDHFTSAEISYCVLQPDVRASFCGTWAAKEALLKAGVSLDRADRLRDIEISRDGLGRAIYKGWHISISHTPGTAVAVCVAQSEPLPALRPTTADVPADVPKPMGARRMNMSNVGIAAAIVLAAFALLLRLVPVG